MDLITYWKLNAMKDARFWEAVHTASEYRKLTRALRRVTGGGDPLFEGWLLFTGQDFCPWYDEAMKKYA